MKKVVHFIGGDFTYGGVEVTILNFLKGVDRNAIEYHIVTFGKVNGAISEELASFSDKITELKIKNFATYIRSILITKNVIKKYKPDLIVFSLWKSIFAFLFLFLFQKKSTKCVLFFHSNRFIHFADALFNRIGIFFCDIIFADSISAKKFIEKKTKKRIEIISMLRSLPESIITKQPQSGHIKFLSICRISKEKGIPEMINMVAALRQKELPFTYEIYGPVIDKAEYQIIQEQVKHWQLESYVHFKGPIRNDLVYSTMIEYDFLLQFSKYEGVAMTVVEAMCCGLVPVVTPVGDIPEYSKDMISAIFYERESNDLQSVLDKVLLIAQDPEKYRKMSENTRMATKELVSFTESFQKALLQ